MLFFENRGAGPGFLLGEVVDNYDEEQVGKVQVFLSAYPEEGGNTGWIPVMSPMAGSQKGLYMLPDVGDTVVVGFLNNDRNAPFVMGSLWSGQAVQPEGSHTEMNTMKQLVTARGTRISIDDTEEKEAVSVTTPKQLTLSLCDETETMSLTDGEGNGLVINCQDGNITLSGSKKIAITAETLELKGEKELTVQFGQIGVKADQKLSLESSGPVSVKGSQVALEGQSGLSLKGSGTVEIKGGMVKING